MKHFLLTTITVFCEDQNQIQPKFIAKWLHHCFDIDSQVQVRQCVKEILEKQPGIKRKQFMLQVANALDVDHENLLILPFKRKSCFYDAALKSLEIAENHAGINSDLAASLVANSLIENESNSNFKLEFKRLIQNSKNGASLSSESLKKCSREADRLLGLNGFSTVKNSDSEEFIKIDSIEPRYRGGQNFRSNSNLGQYGFF